MPELRRSVRPWNHNIEYHRVILASVPVNGRRALDVGCGEGTLTRALAEVLPEVVGIDRDEPSIALAHQQNGDHGVSYVGGDFLEYEFAPDSFDLVCSVATLHHMDPTGCLDRMSKLLEPGGVLAIIGIADSRYPRDLPRNAVAAVVTRLHQLTKTLWEHPSPIIWPPPHTYPEIRDIAQRTLPGARVRRHLLWRYSITWTKPLA